MMNKFIASLLIILYFTATNAFCNISIDKKVKDCSLPCDLAFNLERSLSEKIFSNTFGNTFTVHENFSMWIDKSTVRYLFFINEKLIGIMTIKRMEYNNENIEIVEDAAMKIHKAFLEKGWKHKDTEIKDSNDFDYFIVKYSCGEKEANITITKNKDKGILAIDVLFFEEEE